jgi:capsular polysaccharide transport system permease protein
MPPGPAGEVRGKGDPMDTTLALPVPPRPGNPRFQRLRVIFAMVVREMGTRFGRSAGGYLWAIGEPLGGIMMLAIAFSLALRSPPIGTSFMLFYATGIVPFYLYNIMSKAVSQTVSTNRGLLSYPVVSVLDAMIAKFLLSFLTIFLVGAILFSGIILGLGLYVNLDLGRAVLAFVLAALLGLGVGAVNCVLFGFFPTWKNVWGVLSRPLFLVSGIFYTFDSVPPAFQKVLIWNPLVHIIGVMRSGFYGTYDTHYVSYSYVLGISLGLFVIGAWLMRRHASFLIEQ